MQDDQLRIGGHSITSRLFTGTGKFAAKNWISRMLAESASEMITVALRRIDSTVSNENILDFIVFPYVLPDLTLAKKLEDAGSAAIMPLGAPIGTNRGLETKLLLALLIENYPLDEDDYRRLR